MAETDAEQVPNRLRSSRGLITVGVALSMIAAAILGVIGSGNPDAVFDFLDGAAWLGNDAKGNIVHVNGLTGEVEAVVNFKDAQDNEFEIIQRPDGLWVLDKSTGELRKLSESTWRTEAQKLIGAQTGVVMGDGIGYLVQRPSGVVTPIDPTSLEPKGDPIRLDGPADRAAIDGENRLWVTVPTKAQVVAIEGLATVATHSTGSGGQQLLLSMVGGQPRIVNQSSRSASGVTIDGIEPAIGLPAGLDGDLKVALELQGSRLWIAGEGDTVARVDTTTKQSDAFDLDRPGARLGEPLVNGGRVYIPDAQAREVVVVDAETGERLQGFAYPTDAENPQLFVKDNLLWVNAPDGSKAIVVDGDGNTRNVNKYDEDVPLTVDDADQPPPETPLPPSYDPRGSDNGVNDGNDGRFGDDGTGPDGGEGPGGDDPPPPPTCEPPGAPQVSATAGDEKAVVTWTRAAPNGCPIESYFITINGGRGGSRDVGADTTSIEIDELENDEGYTFSVKAKNAVDYGDEGESNEVTPASDAPAAPENVEVTRVTNRKADGSLTVDWDEADRQGGSDIAGYTITCENRGSGADATPLEVPANPTTADITGLVFGDPYRCSVRATNEDDKIGEVSDPSNEETPIGPPGDAVCGTAVAGDGEVTLTWQAVADRGAEVTYEVASSGAGTDDFTGTTGKITGLANWNTYTFIVTPTNEAGSGAACQLSAQPTPPVLSAPAAAATQTNNSTGLSWADVDGATSYVVYDGAGNVKAQLPAGQTSWAETVHDCSPRGYSVVAIDQGGRSSVASNVVSATKVNRAPVISPEVTTEGFANLYPAPHQNEWLLHKRSLAQYATDPDGDPLALFEITGMWFTAGQVGDASAWGWSFKNSVDDPELPQDLPGTYTLKVKPGHPVVTHKITWRVRDACGGQYWSKEATFNMRIVDQTASRYPVSFAADPTSPVPVRRSAPAAVVAATATVAPRRRRFRR